MKIIHLSDPHIYIDKIHGIDPVSKFKKALSHIKNNHGDADLFAITGDITDLGDKDSYQLFIKIIDEAGLPKNLNPQLIIGNHDNRDEFKINFPNIETLSLIHISEPTRRRGISYAVFCLKKKKK